MTEALNFGKPHCAQGDGFAWRSFSAHFGQKPPGSVDLLSRSLVLGNGAIMLMNSPRLVAASSEGPPGTSGGFTIGKTAMLHHPIRLRFVIVINCPSAAVPIPVFVGAVLRRAPE